MSNRKSTKTQPINELTDIDKLNTLLIDADKQLSECLAQSLVLKKIRTDIKARIRLLTNGPTKLSQSREVYQSMIGQPRGEVVQAIVDQVKISPAHANTYYSLITKAK